MLRHGAELAQDARSGPRLAHSAGGNCANHSSATDLLRTARRAFCCHEYARGLVNPCSRIVPTELG